MNILCWLGLHRFKKMYRKRTEKEKEGWGLIWGDEQYLFRDKCANCGKEIIPDLSADDFD